MRWLAALSILAIAGCATTESSKPEVTERGLLEAPQKLLDPGDILLTEVVRFTDLRGEEVFAPPGIYHVEVHRSGGLLLVPADYVERPLLVRAAPPVDYADPVRRTEALVVRESYGELHVVLLAPTGKHYEAVGYAGNVRPRGAPPRLSLARLKATRTQQASITVTAPAAKQTLQGGQATSIAWRKQGEQHAEVSIVLMRDRRLAVTVASRTKNSGSYAWRVPAGLDAGSYWLAISTLDRQVNGQSGVFTVAAAAPAATPGRFDVAQIQYSRQPQRVVEQASEAPKGGATPQPLTDEQKAAAIQQVRTLAGIQQSPTLPAPLTEVTLTADKPREGKCWYDVYRGWNFPDGSDTNPEIHATVKGYYTESKFVVHFEPVVPGKSYLVDLAVRSSPSGDNTYDRWRVQGAFDGYVNEVNGHILIGFTAAGDSAEVEIGKYYTNVYGLLFGVELTRVD